MTSVLIKGGNLDTETDLCTVQNHENMKAEIGLVDLWAKVAKDGQRTTRG